MLCRASEIQYEFNMGFTIIRSDFYYTGSGFNASIYLVLNSTANILN